MNEIDRTSGDYQILALDVGQKRIGVARAQNQAGLAEPLAIMIIEGGSEFTRLQELFEKWRPAVLVIGLPFNKAGERGEQAHLIEEWVKIMIDKTGFEGQVIYQDETLSSREARADASEARFVDDLAAAIILEDYMDQRRNQNI